MYHILDGHCRGHCRSVRARAELGKLRAECQGKHRGKGFYRWSAEDSKEPAAICGQWQQGEDCWP